MKILDIKNIATLSIKVSEKIAKKNLLKFIRTTIFNSELSFSKTSYFYFYYLSSSSTYEIILYDKSSNDIMLEPFLLLKNNVIEKDLVLVYITDNYFLVSKNNKPMILKKISDTSKDDITIYLEQIYKIHLYKLIYINDEEIINLKELESNLVKYKEYPLFKKKSFAVFIIFLISSFILFILSLFYFYYSANTINTVSQTKIKEKTVIIHPKPLDKTVDIFKKMSIYNIHINKISFIKNKIKVSLDSSDKSKLINFALTYKKDIIIKSIKYDKDKLLHSMEVIIEI